MVNALIVYGTRYGAAEGTAKDITEILQSEEFHVKVVNAKEERMKDIANYQLVIVGSGIQIHKWTGGVYNFNKMPWWSRKAMQPLKTQLEAAGFKKTTPGIYDTRDLQAIRKWIKELARK